MCVFIKRVCSMAWSYMGSSWVEVGIISRKKRWAPQLWNEKRCKKYFIRMGHREGFNEQTQKQCQVIRNEENICQQQNRMCFNYFNYCQFALGQGPYQGGSQWIVIRAKQFTLNLIWFQAILFWEIQRPKLVMTVNINVSYINEPEIH